eukprot:9979162-Prorocentrum_lima.AAC.1
MTPFWPSIVRRPRSAGASLSSNIEPEYFTLPNSATPRGTPMGTVALCLVTFVPPTPQILPSPCCSSMFT